MPMDATTKVSLPLRCRVTAISKSLLARLWHNKLRTQSGSRTMLALGWTAVIALCLYAALAMTIYFAQRSLMYFPDPVHVLPAAAGLPEAEEVPLIAADGVRIAAWHVPPRDGKPVILYFHGNGGALRFRVERFRRLIADGIGLLALEYRGYGGLAGSPSEAGLIADAQAAYRFAAARYPAQQPVLWGESLGSHCGCHCRRAAGGPRHPRGAVHVSSGGRRPALLVSAGVAVDEG